MEIAQQTLERILVRAFVLPSPEIADPAHAADIASPGRRCLHHGLVESDRKEHDRERWLAFALEDHFDLAIDPVACH